MVKKSSNFNCVNIHKLEIGYSYQHTVVVPSDPKPQYQAANSQWGSKGTTTVALLVATNLWYLGFAAFTDC